MVFDIGRVCVKTAGRDAGEHCIVVEVIDDKYVLVDGNTRRRKCNIMHLIPTDKIVDLKKKATTGEVKEAISKLGINVKAITKPKKSVKKPAVQKTKKKKVSEE